MNSEASLRTGQLSQQLAGRIAADPAFAARLQAIPADLPPEEVLARVLDIVRSGGIDLSVDDLATLQTQHSSPASSGEELSEDDLEGLSGGIWGETPQCRY